MKTNMDDLVAATFALEGVNTVTLATRLMRSALYLLESMSQQMDNTEEVRKMRDKVYRASEAYPLLLDLLLHIDSMSHEAKSALHTSATISGAHHLLCEWGEDKLAVHMLSNGVAATEVHAVIDYLKREAAAEYTKEAAQERKQRNIDALAKTVAHSTNIMSPATKKEEKPS